MLLNLSTPQFIKSLSVHCLQSPNNLHAPYMQQLVTNLYNKCSVLKLQKYVLTVDKGSFTPKNFVDGDWKCRNLFQQCWNFIGIWKEIFREMGRFNMVY